MMMIARTLFAEGTFVVVKGNVCSGHVFLGGRAWRGDDAGNVVVEDVDDEAEGNHRVERTPDRPDVWDVEGEEDDPPHVDHRRRQRQRKKHKQRPDQPDQRVCNTLHIL